MVANLEIRIGKILATIGIGTVIIANSLPDVSAEWKGFANSIGLACTAMSVYLMHDVNGKKVEVVV